MSYNIIWRETSWRETAATCVYRHPSTDNGNPSAPAFLDQPSVPLHLCHKSICIISRQPPPLLSYVHESLAHRCRHLVGRATSCRPSALANMLIANRCCLTQPRRPCLAEGRAASRLTGHPCARGPARMVVTLPQVRRARMRRGKSAGSYYHTWPTLRRNADPCAESGSRKIALWLVPVVPALAPVDGRIDV